MCSEHQPASQSRKNRLPIKNCGFPGTENGEKNYITFLVMNCWSVLFVKKTKTKHHLDCDKGERKISSIKWAAFWRIYFGI